MVFIQTGFDESVIDNYIKYTNELDIIQEIYRNKNN